MSHVASLMTTDRCSNVSMCLRISTKCIIFPGIVPLLYFLEIKLTTTTKERALAKLLIWHLTVLMVMSSWPILSQTTCILPISTHAHYTHNITLYILNQNIIYIYIHCTILSMIICRSINISNQQYTLYTMAHWRLIYLNHISHWGRDKMTAVSQTTRSNAFSWMKMLEFWLRFHWSLFLRVQSTIIQHWFR